MPISALLGFAVLIVGGRLDGAERVAVPLVFGVDVFEGAAQEQAICRGELEAGAANGFDACGNDHVACRVAITERAVAGVFKSLFEVNGRKFCLVAESVIVDQPQGSGERNFGQYAAFGGIVAAERVFSV